MPSRDLQEGFNSLDMTESQPPPWAVDSESALTKRPQWPAFRSGFRAPAYSPRQSPMSTRKQADLADLPGWPSRSAGFELVSSKALASFTCVLTDTCLVLETNTILLPIKQHIHWNDFRRCLRGNHCVIYLNSHCSVWKCIGKSYEQGEKANRQGRLLLIEWQSVEMKIFVED